MKDYYEILSLPRSATSAEIDQAIQGWVDRCQGLLSHSNPSVVERVRFGLTLMETVRATLLVPSIRADYDAGLANLQPPPPQAPAAQPVLPVSAPTAAEPVNSPLTFSTAPIPASPDAPAVLAVSASTPLEEPIPGPVPMQAVPALAASPALSDQAVLAPPAAPANASICPKCQAPNPLNAQHCGGCGYKLIRQCPKCGQSYTPNTSFCHHCGADLNAAEGEIRRANKRRDHAGRIQVLQKQIVVEGRSIEDCKDILAGSVPENDVNVPSSPVFHEYKRVLAAQKKSSLTWVWILASLVIGFLVGALVQIPGDIAGIIGLFFGLPMGLTVLRSGAGCAITFACFAVTALVAGLIIAWGGPILLGILAAGVSYAVISLIGNALRKSGKNKALQEWAQAELDRAHTRLLDCQRELSLLTEE